MKHLYFILLGILFLILPVSCLDDPSGDDDIHNAKKPDVETGDPSSIKRTATSIELSGTVIKENGRRVSERGFLYGKETPLTLSNAQKKICDGKGTGAFTGVITDLEADTKYYICAYALNKEGEGGLGLGEEIGISTNTGLGVVTIYQPEEADIKAISVVCYAKIEDKGEGAIIKRGFYISKSPNQEVADIVCESKDEEDLFSCHIEGLKPSMTYYVNAFVRNQFGEFTGVEKSFTTTDGKPKLDEQIKIKDVDFTKATLVANMTSQGDSPIQSRGFYKSTTPDILKDGTVIESTDTGNSFSSLLDNLETGTRYYVKAYATNSFGTVYSADTSFITNSEEPVVNLVSYKINEKAGTVTLSGKLESNGISTVTAVGFCYDTKTGPDIKSNLLTIKPDQTGAYDTTVVLKGGINYYVKAYATNSAATGYSNETVIKTPDIFKTKGTLSTYRKVAGTVTCFIYENKDQIYLLGGGNSDGTTSDELWLYDSRSNDFQRRTDYKAGKRRYISGSQSENMAYIYGGYDGEAKNDFYRYNMARDEWTSLYNSSQLNPDSLYAAASCIPVDNGFYLIGGKDKNDQPTSKVWRYMLSNWSALSNLPEAQYGGIAVSIGNTIYTGLGLGSGDRPNRKLWSTSSDKSGWTTIATMDDSANGIIRGGVTLNDIIYVVDELGILWSYNTKDTESVWKKRSQLPSANRDVHCMAVLNETIYIGMGNNGTMITYDPIWDN